MAGFTSEGAGIVNGAFMFEHDPFVEVVGFDGIAFDEPFARMEPVQPVHREAIADESTETVEKDSPLDIFLKSASAELDMKSQAQEQEARDELDANTTKIKNLEWALLRAKNDRDALMSELASRQATAQQDIDHFNRLSKELRIVDGDIRELGMTAMAVLDERDELRGRYASELAKYGHDAEEVFANPQILTELIDTYKEHRGNSRKALDEIDNTLHEIRTVFGSSTDKLEKELTEEELAKFGYTKEDYEKAQVIAMEKYQNAMETYQKIKIEHESVKRRLKVYQWCADNLEALQEFDRKNSHHGERYRALDEKRRAIELELRELCDYPVVDGGGNAYGEAAADMTNYPTASAVHSEAIVDAGPQIPRVNIHNAGFTNR